MRALADSSISAGAEPRRGLKSGAVGNATYPVCVADLPSDLFDIRDLRLALPPDATMADTLYDRIEQHIKGAESELAPDEALAVVHYLPTGKRSKSATSATTTRTS